MPKRDDAPAAPVAPVVRERMDSFATGQINENFVDEIGSLIEETKKKQDEEEDDGEDKEA